LKYSGQLPAEGINTTVTHPLKELLLLTGGLVFFIVVGIFILGLIVDKCAQYIPYTAEVAISQSITTSWSGEGGEVQSYLQDLANKLAAAQDMPKHMPVTIHYVDNETINAMATLGGHIVIFRGLLTRLHSENTVSMVLAHEIAHIQHRHPIQTLSRGAIITIGLSLMGISAGDGNYILGSAGLLTALTFSRYQEQVADFTALKSLENYYGHIHGATDLVEVLIQAEAKEDATQQMTFLSTHPLNENRIQNILDYAQTKGWDNTGELTPIPQRILRAVQ